VLLVRQGVLNGEYPAPRLAVENEVATAEAQGAADLLDLVDEAVQFPQRRVVGMVAKSRTKLIVVVVLDPCSWQVTVAGLQVLVSRPRATVAQQHLQLRIAAYQLGPNGGAPGRRDELHSASTAEQSD